MYIHTQADIHCCNALTVKFLNCQIQKRQEQSAINAVIFSIRDQFNVMVGTRGLLISVRDNLSRFHFSWSLSSKGSSCALPSSIGRSARKHRSERDDYFILPSVGFGRCRCIHHLIQIRRALDVEFVFFVLQG